MTTYLVTIKLPKNPDHDPRNKIAGPCPINGKHCTDTTGEHHTVLVGARDVDTVTEKFRLHHVTRIEEV